MNRPEEIHNVSQSQFSVARHYGGCTFSGAHYTYDAERDVLVRDVLVRDDILKARRAKNKSQALAEAKEERRKWTDAKSVQEGFTW